MRMTGAISRKTFSTSSLGGTVNLDDLAHSISAVSNHALIQRLSQLLLDWKLDKRTILYILLALAVGFVIGRYRASRAASFQNHGEALLSRVALTNT
jgi:hypothetical protein